jgi:hypothetical protein
VIGPSCWSQGREQPDFLIDLPRYQAEGGRSGGASKVWQTSIMDSDSSIKSSLLNFEPLRQELLRRNNLVF